VGKSKVTRKQGLTAFQHWCAEYPDLVESLDTQKLRELVVAPAPPQPKAPAIIKRPISTDLMPQPFAWVEIPKKGYSIAKYPITNAQFAKFIEADGYKNQQWWTKEGWQKCQEGWHYDGGWKASGKAWTQPRFWTDSTWNGAEYPVVGVSWHESVAFCLWMSDATGEKIMLPTEEQWQYAAQGDDGRDYPWGTEWDASRCNNNVGQKGIGKTTPVRQYEGKGDSPFGVVDMVGNAWEWCLTDYDNKINDINSNTTNRVFRGGSWSDIFTGDFRCDDRGWNDPHYGNGSGGFRVSRS
jgi:formylglycine-generating enzyme required for sulfatase activity